MDKPMKETEEQLKKYYVGSAKTHGTSKNTFRPIFELWMSVYLSNLCYKLSQEHVTWLVKHLEC